MSKIVKKGDMITVYGTGNNKGMPQGTAHLVHRVHGDKLITKGFASMENPGKPGTEVSIEYLNDDEPVDLEKLTKDELLTKYEELTGEEGDKSLTKAKLIAEIKKLEL